MLLNQKVKARLNTVNLKTDTIKEKQKFKSLQISKTLQILYPGDHVCIQNHFRGDTWMRRSGISKIGTAMFEVTQTNYILCK